MTVLSVNDISLSFGVTSILERVSFSLDETDKLGIIGVNGCGKSSLFKMILGEYEPTSGEIFISKDKTVGILRQDGAMSVSDDDGECALEVMYAAFGELIAAEKRLGELEAKMAAETSAERLESLSREYSALNDRFIRDGGLEFRGRCASILEKMGFDAAVSRQPLSTLSGGQRTRLALCRQLSREPDILLLDEPTNHLDIETLTWLESFLINYRKCVLIISHDRYFLDRVTNKTLIIEHCRAKLYNGNYTRSAEQREFDRRVAEKHYQEQQKEIARQEAYIAQQRAWNRERNIIAAESRLKLLDKMEKLERPKEAPKPIQMRFTKAFSSGNEVLTAESLSGGYGEKVLFSDVNFLIKKDERVFVTGPNGCGKSTLIKMIVGMIEPLAGRIEAGYNVEIGYYDQENQNLSPENTVLDELWNAYPRLPEVDIRNTLALFRFTGETVFKQVSVLSGGERARLTLAKLILSHMNLLILDEPTNHLDIPSREALETALEGFDGTVLIISHDRYFINRLATRIFDLADGSLTDMRVDHIGEGYSELCRLRESRESAAPEVTEQKISPNKEQYLRNKKQVADARREANRLERLRKEAEKLEAELERVDAELYGDAATDYKKVAELDARKSEIEERLLEIYEQLE
ncbi:MAG: ABC-F family ATP-binding cassette domain-containing protein [Clostridia bacterium]|nr:ABC-F family ATP-binding cassette domain-containing protein [Clostridia bacterium]